MSCNSIPFSLSEEAFLLNSLSEVTKVWARSTGKATFNFSVQDGQAHLQLGFQLGMPGDPHLPPHPPCLPKTKTSIRRERDRQRAAEHQAKHYTNNPNVVVSTTIPSSSFSPKVISTSTVSVAPEVKVVPSSHEEIIPEAVSVSTPMSLSTLKVAVPVTPEVKVVPSSIEETIPEAVSVSTPLPASTAAVSAVPTYHPICPTRPIRPFCTPEEDDPLKELNYFIDDLIVKVRYSDNKLLKSKHKSILIAFDKKMREEPTILFKSKNYEETFLNLCPEKERNLYSDILGHLA